MIAPGTLREYNPFLDRSDTAETIRSAFAHNFSPFWKDAPEYALAVLDLVARFADVRLVMTDDGNRARGAIFCVAPFTFMRFAGALGGTASLGWQRLTGAIRLSEKGREFERNLFGAYLPIFAKYPLRARHFEVVLFAIHESMRSKGFGKKMMDEAVRRVYARGAAELSLLTDSTMSWQFYERYGFTRSHSYPLGNAYALATGSTSEQAYIYHLPLRQKGASTTAGNTAAEPQEIRLREAESRSKEELKQKLQRRKVNPVAVRTE